MTGIAGPARRWRSCAEKDWLFTWAERRSDSDRVVVSLRGDLDLASSSEMCRRVRQLLALPLEELILDLRGVTFLDSSGLSALLECGRGAEERGVSLAVANLPDQARRVMELTDTLGLFRLVDLRHLQDRFD